MRKAFAAAKPAGFNTAVLNTAQAQEIAPGVVLVRGSWNTTFVRQPDGMLIIEAPISSGYSAQALDEAARRFPGVPVKGVVTTSDSWPHLGGVREYVARGIPVYALDLNRPILERLLAAPYGETPDLLARAPKAATFKWIAGRTVIGSGDTRVELYPIRGENGERMLMAYFPAHRLLYASDEVSDRPPARSSCRSTCSRRAMPSCARSSWWNGSSGCTCRSSRGPEIEAGIAKAVSGSGLER